MVIVLDLGQRVIMYLIVECDFALPYFSELENSVTNIDYKVLPLYPVDSRFDYLERLSSYLGLEFISDEVTLSNDYGNDGFYLRGVNAIPVIDSYVNDIFFSCSRFQNPLSQFFHNLLCIHNNTLFSTLQEI